MHNSGWTLGLLTINAVFLASLLFYGAPTRPTHPAGRESQHDSRTSEDTQPPEKVSKLFAVALEQHDMQLAHDLLMITGHHSPTYPQLVEMIDQFVTTARASSQAAVRALAEDVLLRSESFVYFQPPEKVAAFRNRLALLRVVEPSVEDHSDTAEDDGLLTLFYEALEKHDIQQAHDLLFVAARYSSTDPHFLDMIDHLVTAARASSDPVERELAENVLLRSDSFVYAQPPDKAAAFRSRLSRLKEDSQVVAEGDGLPHLFAGALERHDIQQAHDLLMVAARRSPTDPELVDMIERFVAAARASSHPAHEGLADDVVLRSESLIYFQPPGNVAAFRDRLAQLTKPELGEDGNRPEAEDGGLAVFVAMAGNQAVPIAMRLQAAEQARAQLDDDLFASVLTALQGLGDADVADILADADIKRTSVDAAEMSCLIDLVNSLQREVHLWQAEVDKSVTEAREEHAVAVGTPEAYRRHDRLYEALIAKGSLLLERSGPLSRAFEAMQQAEASDVHASATGLVRQVRESVATLSGRRVLLYNQYVLNALNSLNPKHSTAVSSLVSLLDHEAWLMPMVEKRFSEAWEFALGQLGSDEERLQAMERRVVRTFIPHR